MHVFFILGLIGYIIVRVYKEIGFNNDEPSQQNDHIDPNEYFVYGEEDLQFYTPELHGILHKHVPFYTILSQQEQTIFIDRLNQFFANKKFIICGTTPYKEMPILVAACAIQISFKLSDFSFSYYKYIIIQPKEYQSPHSQRIVEGNVYGNSITLGFENLLYDFKVYNDGHNVGLHEMAHALYVQHSNIYSPDAIIQNPSFNELLAYAKALLHKPNYSSQLFTNYALTHEQEFWASSVELFFEQPSQLQHHYPIVYKLVSNILGWGKELPN